MVLLHVNPRAAESNTFVFQPETLFHSRFAGEQDFAAGAYHALPGQTAGGMQCPGHLAGGAREAGRVRDVAVGGHLATRDTPDLAQDVLEHSLLHNSEYPTTEDTEEHGVIQK